MKVFNAFHINKCNDLSSLSFKDNIKKDWSGI